MALKSGIDDLTGSMAAAMIQAFEQAWPEYMGEDQPVPEPNPQMELMFVAVARGVVRHLTEHPEAFQFAVSDHNGHSHAITGTGSTQTAGAHKHTVTVTIAGN